MYPFRKFDPSSSSGLEVKNFGGPDFCCTKVLPDIFNRSNLEYSAFDGLKVDIAAKKEEKKV